MQTIYPTTLTPQQYLEQGGAQQVQKPENCAHCGGANCLEALGYYERWISHMLEALRIRVRRFLCTRCRVSISCLPAFAQPYRIVNTPCMEAGFNGSQTAAEVHWGWLIAAYWKRYESHLPDLLRIAGNTFGAVALNVTARDFWRQLLQHCGDLASVTEQLVGQFATCLLGTYRCHQRKFPQVK